jgi:hypothetical protein
MPSPTTLFEDAIDVPAWLEADRHLPLEERRHRDREIGKGLDETRPARLVRAWWQIVDRGDGQRTGSRLERMRHGLALALLALGIVGGVTVALAAFRYDGTYPVNVVRVLGLVVVPQLALLAMSLLLLPGRVPGLRAVQDALAAINVGALATWLLNRAGADAGATALFAGSAARSRATRRMAKWQMLCWSQVAAIGFNLGALAAAAALIAFTDLAFGWSTTLSVGSETAARIVDAIAIPWQALAPGAVPDAALVEQSQFFRLDGSARLDMSAPRALTGWWSFTLLAIATYGLLPRLVFWLAATARLQAATRALLLDDPQVTALLDRLSAPEVDLRVTHSAHRATRPPATADTRPALDGTAHAVIWSQSVSRDAARTLARDALGLGLEAIAEAGGGRSLDDDKAALETVAKGADTIVVIVPGWEPPLLEFTDFLTALRATLGDAPSIVVVPVGEGATPAAAVERETWTRAVGKSEDPRLYVEAREA